MSTNTAKDLAIGPPRSPRLRVHEYVILGRTIDKCRALLAGSIGEFHFDCPLDNMLFGFKGIQGDDFKAQVEKDATDEEIATWVDENGTARSQEEIRQWSADIECFKPYNNPEKKQWFIDQCEPLGVDPAASTLFDFLEADDATLKQKT